MYSFQVFIHLKMNTSENDSNWSELWNEPIWPNSFSQFDFKYSDKIEIAFYIEFVNIKGYLLWKCLFPECKKIERFYNLKKHIQIHIKIGKNNVRRSRRLIKNQN